MKAPIFKAALLIAVTSLFFSCQKDVADFGIDSSLDTKAAVDKVKPQEHQFKGNVDAFWDTTITVDRTYAFGSGEAHFKLIGKSHILYSTWALNINPFLFYSDGLISNPYFEKTLAHYFKDGLPQSVGAVIFDDHGNSIWSRILTTPGVYTPTPNDWPPFDFPVVLDAVYEIIGGTGKFEGAKGSFAIHGYWNPPYPYETKFDANGTITLKK